MEDANPPHLEGDISSEEKENEEPLYDVTDTALEDMPQKSRSIQAVLGPKYRATIPRPKPVGPGGKLGRKGVRNLLGILGATSTETGKGPTARRQLGYISEETDSEQENTNTQKEQCLMFRKGRIERGSNSTIGSLSRTQPEKGPFQGLQEGDEIPELTSEEKLADEVKPEHPRKKRIPLDSDDEPDALDDTAQSEDKADEERELLLDYDTNGEPENHHCASVQPVCVVSKNPRSSDVLATFCTGRLQGLIAQENRSVLPPEPKTLKEALTGPHKEGWMKAIQQEYDALIERNTWELVELPPGRRAIGVKWVLKIKTKADGSLEKFKARLVAKGYAQVKGVDYDDTYAPVSRFTTFRALMAKTAHEDLHVSQLDVKNAFLYGTLDETEIFMQQPELMNDGTGRACKLVKSLYGLKQAPLVWYYHIEQTLVENGWKVCDSDWALFKLTKGEEVCWLLLYVDDILVFSKSPKLIKEAEDTLIAKYKMKRENLTKYLGINVNINQGTVELGLKKYTTKLVAKYDKVPSRRTQIPLGVDPNTEALTDRPTKEEILLYQSMVGSIMFAASTTRIDMQHACSKLAQGNKCPSLLHREQIGKAMRYLFDTEDYQLVYSKEPGKDALQLTGYVDANFKLDGKAQTGYVFLLAGAAISWASKKQTAPVISSSEAELVAAVSAAQEAIYLRRLLREIGHEQTEPTPLFTDNTAIVTLSETEKRLGNSKHFHRLHWLRHMVKRKEITLVPVRTVEQTADYLTKILPIKRYHECRERSGLLGDSLGALS